MRQSESNDGALAPWLTRGPVIDIPPDMAALALPSRRFPGAPPRAAAALSWKLFLARARKHGQLNADESEPIFRTAVAEAIERIEQGTRDGGPLSDAVLLALSAGLDNELKTARGAPFIDFLVAEKGLAYALDTLLTATEHLSVRYNASRMWIVCRDPDRHLAFYHRSLSPTELALRAYLAHAPQDVWEQCVQAIEGAAARVPFCRRALLGVLLPDVPALSNALALESRATPQFSYGWLRLTVSEATSLAALGWDGAYRDSRSYYEVPAAVASIVQERGVDALPLLERGAENDAAGRALTWIGTPAAVSALARLLIPSGGATCLAHLKAAAERWPHAAIAALSELVAVDKRVPPTARAILATLAQDHRADLPAFAPWISAAAAAVLDDLAGKPGVDADIADAADLPSVLVNPPWMAPPKKTVAPLALKPLALEPSEHWSAEEREQVLRQERYDAYPWSARRIDAPAQAAAAIVEGDMDALLALWQASVGDGYYIGGCVHAIIDMPAPYNAAVWNAMAQHPINSPGYAIATLGLRGLPGLVAMCERRPADELEFALYFGAVELAAPVARAWAGLKASDVRATARRWLFAYPEHAACGLIAPALGKPGTARNYAAETLRMLAANGHDALLMEVAGRYRQPAVVSALRALLDQQPLDLYPAKFGAAPAFWLPRSWTSPRLASNGKALPGAALDALGAMLRFPQVDHVYAGIIQVQQACTPESLSAFAWDLFRAWQSAGMDPKENWAYAALRLFGDDDVARKLTPLIRTWPGEGQHARAVFGLDVLAAIGTDTAMLLLNGIAQRVKFKGLQDSAREKIRQVAEARNMTADELEDRIAPDLGLDEHGALLLDFGSRQFRVGFDETLKPFVRDHNGTRLADLPKPKQTDDADLAKAALERYKLLKKDARAIAAQQVLRLEVAMCARRRWEPQVFSTFLAGHPLVRHLVQRLVWGFYRNERLETCFRVGPDGGFTNAADDAYALAQGDDIRIGIPHALEMSAQDTAAFGQLFADYELMQPFVQIGRDTHALRADELAADRLLRWDGLVASTANLLGLTSRGWRRGQAQDRGYVHDVSKPLAGGHLFELQFEPGFMVSVVAEDPQQTLKQVLFGSAGRHGRVDKHVPLSALDPIAASELIRDLQSLNA
ncbi:DUF4132 domain-containing protein [Massilia genomosp. 1]|nr:DUF4132 domain-containing protein [Massilia genomosp. 1]